MPISSGAFYSRKSDTSNGSTESSKQRWPRKGGYVSSVVIPPSDQSEPLSLPSGMSSPKGSVNTSPPTSEKFLKPSKLLIGEKFSEKLQASRFARSLNKQQQRQQYPTTAMEVISKAVGLEAASSPSSYLRDAVDSDPLKKCQLWVDKGCGM